MTLKLIKGGGQGPTLRDPLAGLAETTWAAMLHLRGQLDGIKASWNETTQPIERTFYIVWSKGLDDVMAQFLVDNPQFRSKGGTHGR